MPCLDVKMIASLPRNKHWSSLFAQKANINTEWVPLGHPITLLKSNKFNMSAASVKRPYCLVITPIHRMRQGIQGILGVPWHLRISLPKFVILSPVIANQHVERLFCLPVRNIFVTWNCKFVSPFPLQSNNMTTLECMVVMVLSHVLETASPTDAWKESRKQKIKHEKRKRYAWV